MENFEEYHHPVYTNLKIYPELAELELEIGLLRDLGEAFQLNGSVGYNIHGNDFIKNHFLETDGQFIIGYCTIESVKDISADVLLAPQYSSFDNTFYKKVPFRNKVLYLSEYSFTIFNKYFSYYFTNKTFNYNNLICYCMIVKDAAPVIEQVLNNNLPFIDRWCILDTGSTDGTQEIIKRVLKNKKGTLHEEPFVNFKVSRNRCLDLAGNNCIFNIMLDDTYILRGNIYSFLEEIRGDTYASSFSLMIQSSDNEYFSNRIIKSKTNLRYIYSIHEVISPENNINITIPIDRAYIEDLRSDYMEQRTTNRKELDLKMLLEEDQEEPRTVYYIAQTYGCLEQWELQAKYFEKRIEMDGYLQEKIDSIFELARLYNFKLNKPWELCEGLYLKSYNLDTRRPDSLYFIGIHYYLEGNYQKCYNYFKKGFEVGYPIHSQYSLKPTITFHFLPKFLTEVCYYLEDNLLGKQTAELYLKNNQFSNLINNWWCIHNVLLKMGNVSQQPVVLNNLFCIVTDGGWEKWKGSDILTKGMGGSETWIIEMARNIQQMGYNVIVFCKASSFEVFEGVSYNQIELFPQFISSTFVEHCVISRYPEYIPVALKGHAQNVSIIFHDILQSETIIPNHPKLKWIFGLTDWHCEYISSIFDIFKNKIQKINYGIENKSFHETKIKNSFIYSSFPNRGLVILLRMWKSIKNEFPDATLNVYCNLDHEWVNKVSPEEMEEIKMNISQEGITNHGWVDKTTLINAWASSEYFLYPCKFEETFCLTAMEAAISKTLIITNNLAGLQETVGDRGIIVQGNPFDITWQERAIDSLKNINNKEQLLSLNYQFALERSWKSQAEKFINKLKE